MTPCDKCHLDSGTCICHTGTMHKTLLDYLSINNGSTKHLILNKRHGAVIRGTTFTVRQLKQVLKSLDEAGFVNYTFASSIFAPTVLFTIQRTELVAAPALTTYQTKTHS